MFVTVQAKDGVPIVSAGRLISAYSIDGKRAYAHIETDDPDPSWTKITDPEIIAQLTPAQPISAPETGPMLMDIVLKQAELEQKLDAIGIMLVPEIPEV